MPALAARQIQDAQRRSQLEQGLELIDLDRGALAQRVVVQRKVAGSEPEAPPIRSRLAHTLYLTSLNTNLGLPNTENCHISSQLPWTDAPSASIYVKRVCSKKFPMKLWRGIKR